MKYAIVILDGAADRPMEALGGLTPLEAAVTPNLDTVAACGRFGLAQTVPEGFPPGSDVAIMSLLGYDPARYHPGRAPLEAAAQGLEVSEDEWVFRCNLVTIQDGLMKDYAAGNISSPAAERLIALLNKKLGGDNLRFYAGVSYRNLFTLRADLNATTTPPHDILDQPVQPHLPRGIGARLLTDLMRESQQILGEVPGNAANSIWPWGQGKTARLDSFYGRFGIRGAVITAVDLVRGIAALIGWKTIHVPGATGHYDTDYRGKGSAAAAALREYDLVCVHIEAPDEAGHAGDCDEKVRAIEMIDRHILGPVCAALKTPTGDWRCLVMPDHPTPCSLRTHTAEPVPYCMAGRHLQPDAIDRFSERRVTHVLRADGDYRLTVGHRLMETFITP